jgi:surface antigen
MLPVDCSPRRDALVAVVAILSIISSAAAAPPPLLGLTWPGLTREDIEGMDAASQQVLQLTSGNPVAQWQNPASHHAGVVRLIRSFDAHGMPCRTIDYTIRFEELGDSPDHYVVNWCRLRDGEWKIVELTG